LQKRKREGLEKKGYLVEPGTFGQFAGGGGVECGIFRGKEKRRRLRGKTLSKKKEGEISAIN